MSILTKLIECFEMSDMYRSAQISVDKKNTNTIAQQKKLSTQSIAREAIYEVATSLATSMATDDDEDDDW